jgi:hypothetical protein
MEGIRMTTPNLDPAAVDAAHNVVNEVDPFWELVGAEFVETPASPAGAALESLHDEAVSEAARMDAAGAPSVADLVARLDRGDHSYSKSDTEFLQANRIATVTTAELAAKLILEQLANSDDEKEDTLV